MMQRRWSKWIGMMLLGMSVLGVNPALGQGAQPGKKPAVGVKADTAALEEAKRLNDEVEKLYREGKYDEAIPLAEQALAIREKELGSMHADVAESMNNLAELYRQTGDYSNAEPHLRRALVIWEKTLGTFHPYVASALDNLALLCGNQGDYAQAQPLHERALAIREKALGSEHSDVADSLQNLGAFWRAKGDYIKAEGFLRRSLSIYQKALGPEHPKLAFALNSLARLQEDKGDFANAEIFYQQALSIREKSLGPENYLVAVSLNNLAGLYADQGLYTKAEALYQRSLAIREKVLGTEHLGVAKLLDNLGLLYLNEGMPERAEALMQRAFTIFKKTLDPTHIDVAVSLNNLALLYSTKGDYVRAETLMQDSLSIKETALGPQHPIVAMTLRNLAKLYVTEGEPTKATPSMRQALAIEDRNARVLLTTGSDQQKRAYMATLRASSDMVVSLHVQFATDALETKQIAVGTILRRKGVVLDSMRDVYTTLRAHLSDESSRIFDDLGLVNSQLGALLVSGPGRLSMANYRTLIDEVREKRETLEADLSHRSREFQADRRAVSIEDVQAAIPAGAALVELFEYKPLNPKAVKLKDQWGRPRYVAYVLRRDGDITWADLGEAARIDAAVQKLRVALSDPDLTHDPKPMARALDAIVMQPIRKLLGGTRWIFISPDGALNLVPFSALVDEAGHYLVERYLFTYLTSGRDLLRLQASDTPHQSALIVADPAFDDGEQQNPDAKEDSHRGLRSMDMSSVRFTSLPSTAKEAHAIQEHLPGAEVFLGMQATEGAVKAAHGPRILHIATHGFFLPEQGENDHPTTFGGELSPREMAALLERENLLLRAGLALAGANTRTSGANDDGILTALEVASLDLYGTKLVVLSACETGVGKATSGEGVYGLRRSLVIAGAETQVMSLWKVDTGVTRDMMIAYYDKLQRGQGRSEAMRDVQLEMLARDDRAHPTLWASFIVSGNPAALDGKPVTPDFARVVPGQRGCACEAVGSQGKATGSMAWSLIAAMVLVAGVGRSHRRRSMELS